MAQAPIRDAQGWRQAAIEGLPCCACLLGPLAWWFGWANRYVIFLYTHLGAQPFDAVTRSRYWMAALVASALALVYWTLRCWLGGVWARRWRTAWSPPPWWRVWTLWALPAGLGVLAITAGLGAPVLPSRLALGSAAVATFGLGLALAPGRMAACSPTSLLWLAGDGAALIPPLMLLRAVSPEMRAHLGAPAALLAAAGGVAGAALWLSLMTVLRRWRRQADPGPLALLVTGLAEAYLLLPLVHFVLSDPGGPYYISAGSNFFPDNLWYQPIIIAVTGALVYLVGALRRHLLPHQPSVTSG